MWHQLIYDRSIRYGRDSLLKSNCPVMFHCPSVRLSVCWLICCRKWKWSCLSTLSVHCVACLSHIGPNVCLCTIAPIDLLQSDIVRRLCLTVRLYAHVCCCKLMNRLFPIVINHMYNVLCCCCALIGLQAWCTHLQLHCPFVSLNWPSVY